METTDLDYILVPLGLLILIAYHSWLVLRVINCPTKTVIGINAINRRFWVQSIMEDPAKNGILGVQTLRNNIMASSLLASTAIMMSSLIAVLVVSGSSNSSVLHDQTFVLGKRSSLALSVKYFAIILCFMLAFLLNVQSVRYYSHASVLLTVPFKAQNTSQQFASDYVAAVVNRASNFWSTGLHAFYVSLPLFLWVFGPIPMIACSVVLVFLLYFLDAYSGEPPLHWHAKKEEKQEDARATISSGDPESRDIAYVHID